MGTSVGNVPLGARLVDASPRLNGRRPAEATQAVKAAKRTDLAYIMLGVARTIC